MKYPKQRAQWFNHDVMHCDMWQYRDLRDEDLYFYWETIERKYLDRYQRFLRMEFEFYTCGIKGIDYPGAMHIDCYMVCDEVLPLPAELESELREWCDFMDDFILKFHCRGDWDQLETWESSLARRIARFVPDDVYFERRMLRQVVWSGRGGIELDYDPDIAEALRFWPGSRSDVR